MGKPVIRPEGQIHIHLLVEDMKRSIDFYSTVLGFFYDHGIRDMAWLKRDKFLLTLSPGTANTEQPNSIYFGWGVDSASTLEQYYESFFQKRLRLSSPPDVEGGRPYFFIYDPDDYPICFSYAPMDYPDRS